MREAQQGIISVKIVFHASIINKQKEQSLPQYLKTITTAITITIFNND